MDHNGFRLDDPFRLGYRIADTPDGGTEWVPLTVEDFLNPTPRCEACQDGLHSSTLHSLSGLLKRHFKDQNVFLGVDMKMIWHIPGLPEPAPDLFIVHWIREVPPDQWWFDIVETGLRPSLIIEIVTLLDPDIRRLDYERKVEIYEQAKIPEYLIIAPASRLTDWKAELAGYRLGEDGLYRKIQPDNRGYLFLETTSLLFAISKDGREVLVIDASKGNRLLTAEEAILAAEERAAREAEARKTLEAELEKLRAALKQRP
jgi:hypothetical protein